MSGASKKNMRVYRREGRRAFESPTTGSRVTVLEDQGEACELWGSRTSTVSLLNMVVSIHLIHIVNILVMIDVESSTAGHHHYEQ